MKMSNEKLLGELQDEETSVSRIGIFSHLAP
ncbi:hypothetical protein Golax_019621, partial [Gossypium laxum]|nr:hypothetical protein [Gossypium laxum]